jgi:hypothetical protein
MNLRCFPSLQKYLHFITLHGVEELSGFQPSLSSNFHTLIGVLQYLFVVGMRVNGNFDPFLFSIFA